MMMEPWVKSQIKMSSTWKEMIQEVQMEKMRKFKIYWTEKYLKRQ